ncbi:MAG: hypothetical protein ACTHW2_12070 [Tissierella sp.]|uniref:hypothetical protein n=1 Tax=Tissierella sp. TaxID=41274 RepID=UPI003F9BC2E1
MIEKRVFLVGLIEDTKENTIKYIEKLLLEEDWESIYINKEENILGFNKEKTTVFLITTKPEGLELYYSLNIKFDIILYNSEAILDYRFLECNYFVLNSDEENWLQLPLESLTSLAISYGFNNKSTVTISSYNDDGDLSVNIYIQREFNTIFNKRIEPCELTVNIKRELKDRSESLIYNILAAVTTSLILGNKKSHMNIKI